MKIKQLVRSLLPSTLKDYRQHCRLVNTVKEHKKMTRSEIESWIALRYHERIGLCPDLDNPKRYTEKIQWCKLNAMDERKSLLADKLAVRSWVSSQIGEEHLIPLLGIWSSPEEIDFEALPNSFVLKTTHASGTNIIVPDKRKLNAEKAKRQLRRWLDLEFGWIGFERQYMRINPSIIAEEFISNADGSEVLDYKFHCFNGKPHFVRIDVDRHSNQHSRATFDMNWSLQDWCEGEYPISTKLPEKPECLTELVGFVEKLAKEFGHVRVDFYVVDGRMLFGEMTFTSGSGFEPVHPDEWDLKLGDLWDLSLETHSDFPYGG